VARPKLKILTAVVGIWSAARATLARPFSFKWTGEVGSRQSQQVLQSSASPSPDAATAPGRRPRRWPPPTLLPLPPPPAAAFAPGRLHRRLPPPTLLSPPPPLALPPPLTAVSAAGAAPAPGCLPCCMPPPPPLVPPPSLAAAPGPGHLPFRFPLPPPLAPPPPLAAAPAGGRWRRPRRVRGRQERRPTVVGGGWRVLG